MSSVSEVLPTRFTCLPVSMADERSPFAFSPGAPKSATRSAASAWTALRAAAKRSIGQRLAGPYSAPAQMPRRRWHPGLSVHRWQTAAGSSVIAPQCAARRRYLAGLMLGRCRRVLLRRDLLQQLGAQGAPETYEPRNARQPEFQSAARAVGEEDAGIVGTRSPFDAT